MGMGMTGSIIYSTHNDINNLASSMSQSNPQDFKGKFGCTLTSAVILELFYFLFMKSMKHGPFVIV